ncbi:NAD-aldehyde dehydrogenase [Auriscalpium vulgare]|uniref:NAD-aldehyde dehydrogenase n=1 Tax=Auriscalpium vulgare TaxID=40419 RepID=A0ACB8S8A3_9AGAM|nr:NAD-aldehyde dehydrogenase [Auriscalpium vulgare]
MGVLELKFTSLEEITVIREKSRAAFLSGRTKSIAFRKQQLLALAYLLKDNATRFQESLASDLGRPVLESNFLEIGSTITEVKSIYDSVAKWAKPEYPAWSFNWFAMKPTLRKEPKGVALIIGPFNYPIWCVINPMAGAIAAGCGCVLKPSEQSPATAALLAELIPKYLDPELYAVVNGAIPETTKLLDLQWDHILYTGSGRVARIILSAAAKTLSPVTTELGGKSPVFVDPKADLKAVTKRLMWGKFVNAGQTCTAPDYVLVEKDSVKPFVKACKETLEEFYPDGAEASNSYSRLISPASASRLKGLIDGTKGTIVYGGTSDVEKRFVEPTIVEGVDVSDSLMSEELFGPVLPIIAVENVDEAIKLVNSRDHPLALYVFSSDSAYKNKVFDNTQSGAAVANDVIIHGGAEGLPFGGIGPSGSGGYTGKFSFDMFTHLRGSLDNPKWVDLLIGGRFPPYTPKKAAAIEAFVSPSLPSRKGLPPALVAAANGSSQRWGWFLLAIAVAASSGVVLTSRGRLGSA